MPLVPLTLFPTLFDAINEAARESIYLYQRGMDPTDKEKNIKLEQPLNLPDITVAVDCSKGIANPIANIVNTNEPEGYETIDMEKAADLFGMVFAAKLTPVLVLNIDAYIRTGLVQTTVAPGIPTAGSSVAQATTAPGVGTGIVI